jgi:hypothetical protein
VLKILDTIFIFANVFLQATFLGNFRMDEEAMRRTSSTTTGGRKRSVSFKLGSQEREDFSMLGQRSTADSPHIRTIDDTFSAWNDSFRRADSRGSLYSYAGGSPYARTPDIIFDMESDSSTGSLNDSKNGTSRPTSRMSFLSDVSGSADSASGSQAGSVKSVESEESIHCGEAIDNTEENSTVLVENVTGNRAPTNEEKSKVNETKEIDVAASLDNNEPSSLLSAHDGSANSVSSLSGSNDVCTDTIDQCETKVTPLSEPNVDQISVHESDQPGSSSLLSKGNTENGEASYSQSAKDDLRETVDFGATSSNVSTIEHVNDTKNEGIQEEVVNDREAETPCTGREKTLENQQERVELVSSSSSAPELKGSHAQLESLECSITEEDVEKAMDSVVSSRPTSARSEEGSTNIIVEESTHKENEAFISEAIYSSEVSIPVIVSDGIYSEITAEDLSIVDDSSSMSEAKEPDLENSKNDSIQTTIDEENFDKKVRNIGSGGSANREITPVEEEDEEKSETFIDLPKEGDDDDLDLEDPNIDIETSSEYDLKGIRGILDAKRKISIAATSIGFDLDELDCSDDEDVFEEKKPCDLSTKEGLDEFKEFLLGTVGERFLRFWMDVECARHVQEDGEIEM